jgi:hypothetical protein
MRSHATLLLTLLALGGCDPKKDPPPGGTTPGPTGVPDPALGGRIAAPPTAGPVQGTIGGQPFTPDHITIEGRSLAFSKGKGFFPDMQIKFDLPDGPLQGKQWSFGGNQAANPPVTVAAKRPGSDLPRDEVNFGADYAMNLKVTRQTAREVSGAIELRASKPANTMLRGTFTAIRKKTHEDQLDADDAPYIQGRITFTGDWTEAKLAAGFVGKTAAGKSVSNMAGTAVKKAEGGWASSLTFEPQVTTFFATPQAGPGYRHTKLAPGEYVVFVKRNDVPAAWKKVTLADGGQETTDLVIDPAKVGEVVVTVPNVESGEMAGFLSLVPAGLDASDSWVQSSFRAAKVTKGETMVTVKDLPAGKYRAVCGKSSVDVEVTAGKSVKVTLVGEGPKAK